MPATRVVALVVGVVAAAVLLAGGDPRAPGAAHAQPPARPSRIGFLGLGKSGPSLVGQAFRQGLSELGYVEGRNLTIEWRLAEGETHRLAAMARDLVERRVDLIVAAGSEAIQAARSATRTVPIVMANSADPVGSGFVRSLARPGGNVTGVSKMAPEVSGKRLELLRETLPGLSGVAVLRNPDSQEQGPEFLALQAACRAMDVRLHVVEVRGPNDFRRAFAAITGRAGGLVGLGDGFTFTHRTEIVELAEKAGLPAIYASREFVEAGGLMSYGPSLPELFHRSAIYVDKILRGAKPADLPVEQPSRFELVINRRAELLLGLTFRDALLMRADKIIE